MNDFDYPSTPLAPAPAAMLPAGFAPEERWLEGVVGA